MNTRGYVTFQRALKAPCRRQDSTYDSIFEHLSQLSRSLCGELSHCRMKSALIYSVWESMSVCISNWIGYHSICSASDPERPRNVSSHCPGSATKGSMTTFPLAKHSTITKSSVPRTGTTLILAPLPATQLNSARGFSPGFLSSMTCVPPPTI